LLKPTAFDILAQSYLLIRSCSHYEAVYKRFQVFTTSHIDALPSVTYM